MTSIKIFAICTYIVIFRFYFFYYLHCTGLYLNAPAFLQVFQSVEMSCEITGNQEYPSRNYLNPAVWVVGYFYKSICLRSKTVSQIGPFKRIDCWIYFFQFSQMTFAEHMVQLTIGAMVTLFLILMVVACIMVLKPIFNGESWRETQSIMK